MLLLLAGCVSPNPQRPLSELLPPPPRETPAPPVPRVPTTADVLDAECRPDPLDPLRATCRLSLSWPVPAEVELTDGEEVVVFSTRAARPLQELPIWGLTADSVWSFVARAGGAEVTGELVTGPLPEPVAIDVAVTGAASAIVGVLGPIDCAGGGRLTVIDGQGRVRWAFDTGGRDVDLVQYTEAGTLVAIFDEYTLLEVDLAGVELLRKSDFGLPVHHDVFRRNDRIYTLLADAREASDGVTYIEDIVVAVDLDGNEVWRWDERDHLDPTLSESVANGFWENWWPDAIDAWHTNGLYVTEDDRLLLSLRREDTVFEVAADGSIGWVLAGDGVGGVLPTTFPFPEADLAGAPTAGVPNFTGQHHPALLPDGHVTVFDNEADRALEIALDHDAGVARFVADWGLGLNCPIQSSVFPLDGGGRVVTCGDAHTWAEFDRDGAEIARYVLSCANDSGLPRTTRGQPLDLWAGTTAGEVTATRLR